MQETKVDYCMVCRGVRTLRTLYILNKKYYVCETCGYTNKSKSVKRKNKNRILNGNI